MFTQPLMYTKIRTQMPVLEKYAMKLINEEVVTEQEVKVRHLLRYLIDCVVGKIIIVI